MDESAGTGMIVLVLTIYMLPWILASLRRHHNSMAIFVFNLLLGWTFLGWVIALVWACTAVQRPQQPARVAGGLWRRFE